MSKRTREPCNTCNRMTTIRCPQCRQPTCAAHCLKMADGDSDGCLHCRRQEAAEIRAVAAQVNARDDDEFWNIAIGEIEAGQGPVHVHHGQLHFICRTIEELHRARRRIAEYSELGDGPYEGFRTHGL